MSNELHTINFTTKGIRTKEIRTIATSTIATTVSFWLLSNWIGSDCSKRFMKQMRSWTSGASFVNHNHTTIEIVKRIHSVLPLEQNYNYPFIHTKSRMPVLINTHLTEGALPLVWPNRAKPRASLQRIIRIPPFPPKWNQGTSAIPFLIFSLIADINSW